MYKPAPYGRHTSLKWGPMISNQWGWWMMELPVFIVMACFLLYTQISIYSPTTWLMVLFLFHYANRVFIYPFRIKTKGKMMPLIIAGSAIIFNVINGSIIGYSLLHSTYEVAYFTSPRFLVGVVLFFTGMIINNGSDSALIKLRSNGNTSYQIPTGGLFKYVSCPNYLGEIIEWLGFALMCSTLGGWSFFIWTCANLIPRALAHHKWYREKFNDYPANRKVLIPYLF